MPLSALSSEGGVRQVRRIYCFHLKLVESLMSVPQQVNQSSLYISVKRLLRVTPERQWS
jgi:hypothetical protein